MSDEVEKLVAKNAELLAELKATRAKLIDAQTEKAAEVERANTAEGKLKKVLLENPVDDVLKKLVAIPSPRILDEIRQTFGFSLAEDGTIKVGDKDGNPLMILGDAKEAREATFTVQDIRFAMEEHGGFDDVLLARGIGGTGMRGPQKPIKVETAPVASQFGLR